MFSLWQSSDDIPFWVQLFLLGFVLIGIVPFFQKLFSRIDEYLQALSKIGKPDREATTSGHFPEEALPSDFSETGQLNEYEYIVFRRLAMAGKKGRSLKAIADGLHMGRPRVERVLQSLGDKGLVSSAPRMLLFRWYLLTPRGRDYAVEQGFIVEMRRTGSR